jgi:uncharacterized membrane protein YgdD (TMEM256/DUF423 family)
MSARRGFGIAAAALGNSAVALGAFGAHALQGRLDETALRVWHIAVQYQFWHTLALLGVCALAPAHAPRVWRASGILFVAGTAIFSGSLYALALGAPKWVGAITPLGGLALIAGWMLLGAAFFREKWT